MKSKKIIIIIMIIIVIIAIICFAVIKLMGNPEENNVESEDHIETAEALGIEIKAEKVKDYSVFKSVETCIQNHVDETFICKDMTVFTGETMNSYGIAGTITNPETQESQDVYMILRVDLVNLTFEVEELDSSEYNSVDEIDIEAEDKTIEDTGDNYFEFLDMSEEDEARGYFDDFSKLEIENTEEAYSKLDEEYKKIRFPEYSDYQEYVEEYKNIIETGALTKYSVNYEDEYIEYVVVDNYENSYTIRVTSVMDYKVKLDNYTIKIDTYDEDYSKLSTDQKVQANAYIFLQMINTKDYEHAYNLLDETFRNTNFATLDEFKEYVRNNFFAHNVNSYNISIQEEGDTYVYETKIKESSSSSAQEKKLTIIMQLKEGSDFVMSFSLE